MAKQKGPGQTPSPHRDPSSESESIFVLARLVLCEPLGVEWTGEWLNRNVTLATKGRCFQAGALRLQTEDGKYLPAQFSNSVGLLLSSEYKVEDRELLHIFFRLDLDAGQEAVLNVIAGNLEGDWFPKVKIEGTEGVTLLSNGIYTAEFDPNLPLPVNALRLSESSRSLCVFSWPEGVTVIGVDQKWILSGAARAVLARSFRFENPSHEFHITFDFRAGDPWIGISSHCALGKGTALKLDLESWNPSILFHRPAYDARTLKTQPYGQDAPVDDTSLEPEDRPIAILGPIWRDIWYGGGAFAYAFSPQAKEGLGVAAVRGSRWTTPEGISPESQNFLVRGDKRNPGRVWIHIPTEGGTREWALIAMPPDKRSLIPAMIRSHADIPLDTVLRDWVLDWPSTLTDIATGREEFTQAARVFLEGNFNRQFLNPTHFPRHVRKLLDKYLMARAEGVAQAGEPVRSRYLAALAYIFMNPDYWPGPAYRWTIGNPNFHTDMYNIILKVGLAMPDHPHALEWVRHGAKETLGNLMRDSYPGGAWAESLSYSAYFFSVAENARLLKRAGLANPFKEWGRLKEVATWLACMHTPEDPRYGSRQMAPIGDTGPGHYIRELRGLAEDFEESDPDFAVKLRQFPESEPGSGALDLGSREFPGFGAMLRGNPYNPRHESFVAVKAGPARNHYQGDELSFYFSALGVPLAIDYACHYSPRPWSASMHNRPDMDGLQPEGVAVPLAMAASSQADVFVAEESIRRFRRLPLAPHHTEKPGWEYPLVKTDEPWKMRRYSMLVKHVPGGSLPDYLVIRDEIRSPQPVWWNLHVLARTLHESRHEGKSVFHFPGQLDVDLTVYFLSPSLVEVEKRVWGWRAEGKDRGALRAKKGREYEDLFFGAYIPESFVPGSWGGGGEMGQWLRVKAGAGDSRWMVVLMPHYKGSPAPGVHGISDTSFVVEAGDARERVMLGTGDKTERGIVTEAGIGDEFQAALHRNGQMHVLLHAGC